jgi:hypothetical protein
MQKNLVAATATIAAMVCATGWFHDHQKLGEVRRMFATEALFPIVEMLKQNTDSALELENAEYAEPGAGFVGAYLIKIRRDGVPKHSGMKQRIDQIVNNDTAILALLAEYSSHAKTPAFRESAQQFRDYATRLRERWQSVPEVFMAGGSLPEAALQFPAEFEAAVSLEISAS